MLQHLAEISKSALHKAGSNIGVKLPRNSKHAGSLKDKLQKYHVIEKVRLMDQTF